MIRGTIAVDFDGVIHPYKHGWCGPVPSDEPPTDGAREYIAKWRAEGWRVVVFTCRALTADGRAGIVDWLAEHGITVDEVTAIKPHAMLYIDDRGLRFTGDWSFMDWFVQDVERMKPWNAGGKIKASEWEAKPPRCGTCGEAVDQVDAEGRYLACGHLIPGAIEERDQ